MAHREKNSEDGDGSPDQAIPALQLPPPPYDYLEDSASSIESDRCWMEQYRGDSHKWLMRDCSKKKSNAGLASLTRESFQTPQKLQSERAIRRELLLEKIYKEVAEEVMRENADKPMEMEFDTTYKATFDGQGFQVKEGYSQKDEELCKKYPLYSTPPITYYRHLIERKGNTVVIPGLTKVNDKNNPFKRSYNFTKAMTEGLDE